MKTKMSFRVICAFLGFLLLFMVISLIVMTGVRDEDIGIGGAAELVIGEEKVEPGIVFIFEIFV